MAIETFRIATKNLSDVKTALESNQALLYFSEFVLTDEGKKLEFYDNNGNLLIDFYYNTDSRPVLTADIYGNETSLSIAIGSGFYIDRIVTTDKGIAIGIYSTSSKKSRPLGMFVSTTNNGVTGVAVVDKMLYQDPANTTCREVYTATADTTTSINTMFDCYYGAKSHPLTAIHPLGISQVEDYFPNIFALDESPYKGQSGRITIDGEVYISNGYILLKDE